MLVLTTELFSLIKKSCNLSKMKTDPNLSQAVFFCVLTLSFIRFRHKETKLGSIFHAFLCTTEPPFFRSFCVTFKKLYI